MTTPATSSGSSEEGETMWERAERRAREARANRATEVHPRVVHLVSAPPPSPEEQAARDAATLARHEEVRRAELALRRSEASSRMVTGALICAVGIVVTVVSYSMVDAGGGRYIVAWGAILAGGVRFVRGLVAYVAGWDPDA